MLLCRNVEKNLWKNKVKVQRAKRKRQVKKEKDQRVLRESKLPKVRIAKKKNLHQNHKIRRIILVKIIKMRPKFRKSDHKKPKKATSSKTKT